MLKGSLINNVTIYTAPYHGVTTRGQCNVNYSAEK